MTDITVPVPGERIADFYQFFGRWLAGDPAVAAQFGSTAEGSPNASAAPEQLKPWIGDESERVDAEWLWGKLSPRGKGMFSLLMDAPKTRFTGREIASAVQIPNGASGVAGVLAWPARFCIGIGRNLPTSWQGGEDGAESSYWMEPDVAALFAAARA